MCVYLRNRFLDITAALSAFEVKVPRERGAGISPLQVYVCIYVPDFLDIGYKRVINVCIQA